MKRSEIAKFMDDLFIEWNSGVVCSEIKEGYNHSFHLFLLDKLTQCGIVGSYEEDKDEA